MANSNARGTKGNKGGGRLGYIYEKEQLKRLRKIADRGIALVEAILKGKVSDKEIEKFKLIQPTFNKVLDKMQANKQDITTDGEKINPVPIYGGLSRHNSDEEDIQANPEN